MKQIFVIVLLLINAMGVSAQEKIYKELIGRFSTFELVEQEDSGLPDSILVSKYLHRVINTDSIYSFFQANIFQPLRNLHVILDDHPIPNDTLIGVLSSEEYGILKMLSGLYEPDRTNNIIPPQILSEMIYVVIDSTTQYTQPIYCWDILRMDKVFIAETSMKRTIIPIQNEALRVDKRLNKKTNEMSKHIEKIYNRFMANAIYLKISLPIFDEEYKYALLFFVEGKNKEQSFAIFERKVGEWNPIFVTRVSKGSLLFSNYLSGRLRFSPPPAPSRGG